MYNSKTVFFRLANFYGGTEQVVDLFNEQIAPDLTNIKNYINIVIPGIGFDAMPFLDREEKIIFWLHNLMEQYNPETSSVFFNKTFMKKVHKIIVPSQYAKTKLLNTIKYNADDVCVIENPATFIKPDLSKFKNVDKVKAIYISSAQRGLEFLLRAYPKLDKRLEIEVFSDFHPNATNFFNQPYPVSWAEKIANEENITFYWKSPPKTVRKHLAQNHMMVYPSTWNETFCLSAIEALGSGLLLASSNQGALEEVTLGYGNKIEWSDKFQSNIDSNLINNIEVYRNLNPKEYFEDLNKYIDLVNESVETIISGNHNPEKQIEDITKAYSLETIKEKWIALDKQL